MGQAYHAQVAIEYPNATIFAKGWQYAGSGWRQADPDVHVQLPSAGQECSE